MFFTGDSQRKKIGLGGRSRVEETREQVLERTRLEREKRKQNRVENASALTIQAIWRGWMARKQLELDLRSAWDQQYAPAGVVAPESLVDTKGTCLTMLMFFLHVEQEDDVARLASVLHALLPVLKSTGIAHLLASPQGQQQTGTGAAENGQLGSLMTPVCRLQFLMLQALRALVLHRHAFRNQLAMPRASLSANPSHPTALLLESLIVLAAPETWSQVLPPPTANALSGALVCHVLKHGMLRLLPQLLMVAIAEGEACQTRTCTEAVVTQLCVRVLSIRQAVHCIPPQQGMQNLLCVPALWSKFPSLAPIASRICRMAMSPLAGCPGALAMAKLLPGESDWVPGGKVAALAALFGNLVSVGERIFQQADKHLGPDASFATALQLTQVLNWAICLLPIEPFFPDVPAKEDAEEDPCYAAACTSAELAAAHCRGGGEKAESEEMLPQELQGQITQVFEHPGKQLLQQLVASLLPLSAGAPSHSQEDYKSSWAAGMQGATSLCLLLGQLLALPGQRSRLLLMLAFGFDLVPRMWYSLLKGMRLAEVHGSSQQQQQGQQQDRAASTSASTNALSGGIIPSDHPCAQLLPLNVMCAVFSAQLAVGDLDEMYAQQRPLPLAELYSGAQPNAGLIALLKSRLWSVLWEEPGTPSASSVRQQTDLMASALKREFSFVGGQLYGDLYDRNCRRNFCPEQIFRAPNLGFERMDPDRFVQEAAAPRATGRFKKGETRAWQVLQHAPALVPFEDRARLFQAKVAESRNIHHEMEIAHMAEIGIYQPRFVHIRRQNLLYDGYDSLHKLGDGLKGRVRVQFIDEHGQPEAGVDGGGLFKDFMESLIKQGFHEQYGLFTANAQNELYPSPASFMLMGDAPTLLEFLGCMLGKAMYEGILLELPLARFFLKKFRGGTCDLNDLPSLDEQLYENLRKLRQSPGAVSELGLVFTATRQVYGKHEDIDLKPNGRDIAVTSENVAEYIHRIADFRLNKELRGPCGAFLTGFFMMVQPEWIAMFNEEELQTLISGRMEEGLDLADLRAHTAYAGGYHEEHPVVLDFWKVLSTLSPEEQREFLKFVTACSRAPLLGFKDLEPQFCIQMAGSVLDPSSGERLPTAATCMNLLKLPPYSKPQVMRGKLLYAINSAKGFDLS